MFKENLAEDYLKHNPPGLAYQLTLVSINKHLMQEGKSLANYSNMPPITIGVLEDKIDRNEEGKKAKDFYDMMNDDP